MATPATVLHVEALCKSVTTPGGELVLLDNIHFSVQRGDSVAIVGASGSGKSTLLGLLAGLDVPSSGEVLLNGVALSSLNEESKAQLRAQSVGFIFQNFQLLPALTALENVMLPLELRKETHCEARAREYLARVGLSERLQHYPRQLSGGEQQRVAIARAFAGSPAILFADEPTGNLDGKTALQIMELLFALNRDNQATLILVTHDEKLAARCRRHLVMDSGVLIESTVPTDNPIVSEAQA
jgi:putative ABC transport system ATP-binding protein